MPPKRVTKTSHSIAVRRLAAPPEQATNIADNSCATKGGQITRYRQHVAITLFQSDEFGQTIDATKQRKDTMNEAC
jgi:hypothetical protein